MGIQGDKFQLSNQGYIFVREDTLAIAMIGEQGSFETTPALGKLEEHELKSLCAEILHDLAHVRRVPTRLSLFISKYTSWATEGKGIPPKRKRARQSSIPRQESGQGSLF